MTALKRIVLHWTAGSHTPSPEDREHYHFIIDGAGRVHAGDLPPEANISTSDADGYAAHTLRCNTGSIGVSLAAMAGARERPFDAGRWPITEAQVEALARHVAELCRRYSIPVTRQTVLSHAEVQPTLGIRQRGKWDITVLPGMAAPGDPVEVGDRLRERIAALAGAPAGATKPAQNIPGNIPAPPPPMRPLLVKGSRGEWVRELQEALVAAGMPLDIDGDFGPATEAAVRSWQRQKGLDVDGRVGPATWASLCASDSADRDTQPALPVTGETLPDMPASGDNFTLLGSLRDWLREWWGR